MKTRALVLVGAAAVLLCAAPSRAQQPAPERQQQDEDVPTLTTQDIRPVEGQPAGAQTEAPPPEDPSLTPEEQADVDTAAAPGEKSAAPAKKKGPSAAELSWRQQYTAAESRARAAEQRAQEAELRSNELRNQLGTVSSTSERNDVAARLEQQGNTARQAREEANKAKAELERLRAEEGSRRRFQLAPGPAATTNGRPNPNYHQQNVARAKAALDDANRRIQIYQARINDARGRILNNSGSGDNYAQARIQTDLDDSLRELQKAQTDAQAAQGRYDTAANAARQAGVPVQQ